MPSIPFLKTLGVASVLVLPALLHLVHAATTDIANVPLFTSSATSVKSNILFILDNSGSMGWDYLPDDVPRSGGGNKATYGALAAQCNGVQYNSALSYLRPVDAVGTPYPNASFTAAKDDGFLSNSGTVNLTNRYYYDYTPSAAASQPAMSYTYTAKGLDTTSVFYAQCNSAEGSAPGSAVFTKVIMSALSPQQQNYANWYSYYRTRMLMMKSSVGLAFAPVDAKYRIGYNTISNASASGANFLDVRDFDATQKLSFYTKLYAATPGNSTPLRGAVSHAGQYFAHKAPGQTADPVQYSCQKNFTILSTDGYWNTGDETSS
jgi:type IV pilus assembly protein PilY1